MYVLESLIRHRETDPECVFEWLGAWGLRSHIKHPYRRLNLGSKPLSHCTFFRNAF